MITKKNCKTGSDNYVLSNAISDKTTIFTCSTNDNIYALEIISQEPAGGNHDTTHKGESGLRVNIDSIDVTRLRMRTPGCELTF